MIQNDNRSWHLSWPFFCPLKLWLVVCASSPRLGTMKVAVGVRVHPGAPRASLLYYRCHPEPSAMPPRASYLQQAGWAGAAARLCFMLLACCSSGHRPGSKFVISISRLCVHFLLHVLARCTLATPPAPKSPVAAITKPFQ